MMKPGKSGALICSILWIASMSDLMAMWAINANGPQDLDWILSDESKSHSGK